MSWTAETGVFGKKKIDSKLAQLELDPMFADEPSLDQFRAAKDSVRELAKSVPGPNVKIILSGHANGVGWQGVENVSDDFIQVRVEQHTEEIEEE